MSAQNSRQDFPAPFSGKTLSVVKAGEWLRAFAADLAARFTADPQAAPWIALYAPNTGLLKLGETALLRAGLTVRTVTDETRTALSPRELGLWLDATGERCAIIGPDGMLDEASGQLLTVWTALELGETTLLLPVSATRAAETLAVRYSARVEFTAGSATQWMNALAERFPRQFALHFDGLNLALSALNALTQSGMTLSEWRQAMPGVCRRSRSVPVPPARTGAVLQAFARRERDAELGGGVHFQREGGWAWVCPEEDRPSFRVVTEAASAEVARELCDFCENALKRLAGGDAQKPSAR